jgi:glycosyltransferase involved in cell wall biosynthesis
MTRICFVTNELFPLAPGGIGRMMYNFAVANALSVRPVEMHFLLPASMKEKAKAVASAVKGLARVHFCPSVPTGLARGVRILEQAKVSDSFDERMRESLRFLYGVLDAEHRLPNGAHFDFVEFPDFGGWAVASIAAKRAGVAFHNTQIVVRVHSTFGLIVDHEPFYHEPSNWVVAIEDLERQSLKEADIIVAHLPSIAELNAQQYGFDNAWLERVVVESPPILLSDTEQAAAATRDEAETNPTFLFSSRLQPFKRPDLFIKAAVHLVNTNSLPDATFEIVSYGWDMEYIEWLEALIPPQCRHAIRFAAKVSASERGKKIATSILVIPSDFESLCLLAYEASAMGSRVILNRRCVAFGGEPGIWKEGENCLMFDGDFLSLAAAMQKALIWSPETVSTLPDRSSYWQKMERVLHPEPTVGPSRGETGQDDTAYLIHGGCTLDEFESQFDALRTASVNVRNMHVAVPRELMRDAGSRVRGWRESGLTVHLVDWTAPTPTEVAHIIERVESEFLALIPCDMRPDPAVWGLGPGIMATSRDVEIVTSHLVGGRSTDEPWLWLTYGDTASAALTSNRIAHRASLVRVSALRRAGIREQAEDRWFEDFCVRIVCDGGGVVVIPTSYAEADERPVSRLKPSRFYGTLQNEALTARGMPFRAGNFGPTSIRENLRWLQHADWQVYQKNNLDRLQKASRFGVDDLTFSQVAVVSQDKGANYSLLELQLSDVKFAGRTANSAGFKLLKMESGASLEFRSHHRPEFIFDAWPPLTKDDWGVVAAFGPASVAGGRDEMFGRLSARDAVRFQALVRILPAIIGAVGLADEESDDWLRAARQVVAQLDTLR